MLCVCVDADVDVEAAADGWCESTCILSSPPPKSCQDTTHPQLAQHGGQRVVRLASGEQHVARVARLDLDNVSPLAQRVVVLRAPHEGHVARLLVSHEANSRHTHTHTAAQCCPAEPHLEQHHAHGVLVPLQLQRVGCSRYSATAPTAAAHVMIGLPQACCTRAGRQ